MRSFWFSLLIFLLVSCNPQNDKVDTQSTIPMPEQNFQHNLTFNDVDTSAFKGFQEVVFSVTNMETAIDFYGKATGWELIYKGVAATSLNPFWELSTECEIEEALFQNPGDREGFLRLVKFKNVAQQQIRSSGRPWDTGGIFDINLRAQNLQVSFNEFQAFGWNAYSDPIRYQFGKFDVEEVVMQGPDGIAIAMMQRHAPTLEGYPNLKVLSHVFNSTHISKDIEKAKNFFIDQLGFKIYMQFNSIDRKAGPNVLGIPQNINDDIELPVFIVHPDGVNFGSVEFIQLKGLDGHDFSALAKPPNLGILMLRFPVKDAEKYSKEIQGRGVSLHRPITELEIQPYGKVKSFAVLSPDGVWLEFLEIQN